MTIALVGADAGLFTAPSGIVSGAFGIGSIATDYEGGNTSIDVGVVGTDLIGTLSNEAWVRRVVTNDTADDPVASNTFFWSETDKNGSTTRSSDGKTATTNGGIQGIRSTIPLDLTKKIYLEVVLSCTGTTPGSDSIGVVNGTASLSSYMGSDANGFVVLFQSGNSTFFTGNSQVFPAGGAHGAKPIVLCLAIDGPNKTISARIGNGPWGDNNTDLAQVTMRSFAAVTGTLYLGFSADQSGDNATIRSALSAMQYAVPAGYVTVDV